VDGYDTSASKASLTWERPGCPDAASRELNARHPGLPVSSRTRQPDIRSVDRAASSSVSTAARVVTNAR